MKVKMKVKKWRPEKLKMVKKHFFPELSGDLWGVICYHHWYPRAGLEGREKTYFSKKKLRLKKMQNYPLSIFHVAVRPESLPGADLSTFQKVRFSDFSTSFGPFSAPFWSKITPQEFVSNLMILLKTTSGFDAARPLTASSISEYSAVLATVTLCTVAPYK